MPLLEQYKSLQDGTAARSREFDPQRTILLERIVNVVISEQTRNAVLAFSCLEKQPPDPHRQVRSARVGALAAASGMQLFVDLVRQRS